MNRQFQHAAHVWQAFPGLRAAALVVENITDGADVDSVVDHYLATARERIGHVPESGLPAIEAWRRVYSQMGLKPTQYRCAAESLLRRLRTHGELPRLHPLVDLCNAASAAYATPIAAFDLGTIEGDFIVRPATGTETYFTFTGEVEHPAAGEIVYADEGGNAHSRRWVTRQSGSSAISPSTTHALIVAEAVHDVAGADLDRLLSNLTEQVSVIWGTTPANRRLTATEPRIRLDPAGAWSNAPAETGLSLQSRYE